LAGTLLVAGDAQRPWVAGLLETTGLSHDAGDAHAELGLLVCPLSAEVLERLMGTAGRTATDAVPQVLAEPAVAALAERWCKQPVALQQRAERLLQAAQSPWNLAQFELANLARSRRWAAAMLSIQSFANAPQWRLARWALVALVMVNLIGLNALALREQAQLTHKRQSVVAVLNSQGRRTPADGARSGCLAAQQRPGSGIRSGRPTGRTGRKRAAWPCTDHDRL
jgi:general secretion pathway protein L